MMKVAVTAASGRLGHALLEALSGKLGAEGVIAVARSPEKIDAPHVETRRGDYNAPDEMTDALREVDTVVMISAPVVAGTDRVLLHRNVIDAASQAGAAKIVYTSVVGSGAEKDTWYWPTQQINRQTERDVRDCGLQWIVARNGLYLELDLNHIIAANETGTYRNNGGAGRCGYITIDELAAATAELAIRDRLNGRIYNLVGDSRSQDELVALANHVFGLNVAYEEMSDEDNVARFMKDPRISARGEDVARMLTGCFQAMRRGALDVDSDFEAAAGRPCKSTEEMMEDVRRRR